MIWLLKLKFFLVGEEKEYLILDIRAEFNLLLGKLRIQFIDSIFNHISRPEECGKVAHQMLGKRLVTKQSGPGGKPCDKVRVSTYLFIAFMYIIKYIRL